MTGKIPSWFQPARVEIFEPDLALPKRKFRIRFVDRTLRSIAGILEGFVSTGSSVHNTGLLQGIEARLKLAGVVVFVVCTSLVHSISCVYILYALTVLLAVLSKIPVSFFLRRVWLIVALFVGIIAIPATLNIFTPGENMVTLFSLDRSYRAGPYFVPRDIAITRQGVSAALLLGGRVAASLSFVLLLILTTPWSALLKALRSFLVPQIYVQTLAMTMRYLLLLAEAVRDMCLAKKSRTLRMRRAGEEQRWVAGQLGSLFKWSMQLSGEVYRSMVARGYRGEARALASSPPRMRDYGWMAFCVGTAVILFILER